MRPKTLEQLFFFPSALPSSWPRFLVPPPRVVEGRPTHLFSGKGLGEQEDTSPSSSRDIPSLLGPEKGCSGLDPPSIKVEYLGPSEIV